MEEYWPANYGSTNGGQRVDFDSAHDARANNRPLSIAEAMDASFGDGMPDDWLVRRGSEIVLLIPRRDPVHTRSPTPFLCPEPEVYRAKEGAKGSGVPAPILKQ